MIETKPYSNVMRWQLIFIISFGALFFGLFKMDKPIWIDEGYSIYTASYSFEFLIESLKTDTGPPLHYIALFFWMKLFGISETAVRSLSVLCYFLTIGAIYYFALSVYKNSNIGLISSALYTLSPLAFGQAQNARTYSLLSLLAILSSIFFVKLFLDGSITKKKLFLYILVNALGTFAHYWYVFCLFSHFVIYWILSNKKGWKIFFLTLILSVLPFLTLWGRIAIIQIRDQKGKIDWMLPPTFYTLIETIVNFYCYKENLIEGVIFYFLVAGMVLIGINKNKIVLRKISEIKEFFLEKSNLIFILFFTISLLTPFFVSQFKPIFMPTRQPILVLFAFALSLGALLERFVYEKLLIFFLWCCLLYVSLTVFNSRIDPIFYLYSNKNTADYILENAHRGDYVIFTNNTFHLITYYFRREGKEDFFNISLFPRELTDSDTSLLEKQAKSITDKMDLTKDPKIWVLCKRSLEKNKILLKELDDKLKLERALDLQGNFHDVVYLYKRKLQETQ